MRKIIMALILAFVLCLTLSQVVTVTDITVTAAPSYVSFSSTPITWTLNNATGSGSGKVAINTKYYSNPLGEITAPSATVVDGECRFTWVNDSSVNIAITVNCGSFTDGSADMTNSNLGSNGATTYGGYSWYSGMSYSNKKIIKASSSDILYTTSTPGEDKKWGAEILTRTDVWIGSTPSTATMSITAAEV